jgi:serine-type D-Ala-D-Ala carboxypeptidase
VAQASGRCHSSKTRIVTISVKMTPAANKTWTPLQQLLHEGITGSVYTAAVALVGLKGELVWQGEAGCVSREPKAAAVTPDTRFDLASLTKPLATTLALMALTAAGKFQLESTLAELVPGDWLPPDKGGLTLEHLLTHTAGLPAWRPFYREVLAAPAAARATLLERLAAAAPLESAPGTATVYSDLGFMLLKAVVEQISGHRLDEFCGREIFEYLGLDSLTFNPRQRPGGEALSCAATEAGLIPGRPLSGEVHDENAWAAGGVAGHAGLFGTGRDVFSLAAALYRAYQGRKPTLLAPNIVRLFLTSPAGGPRACGFDTPSPEAALCSAGRFFSPASVGHTGFTGTSFWLDLELGQMVVLLTNRVHLGRDDLAGIKAFRPRFHEAASRALGFDRVFRE